MAARCRYKPTGGVWCGQPIRTPGVCRVTDGRDFAATAACSGNDAHVWVPCPWLVPCPVAYADLMWGRSEIAFRAVSSPGPVLCFGVVFLMFGYGLIVFGRSMRDTPPQERQSSWHLGPSWWLTASGVALTAAGVLFVILAIARLLMR